MTLAPPSSQSLLQRKPYPARMAGPYSPARRTTRRRWGGETNDREQENTKAPLVRLLTPPIRQFIRRLALLGGLVFVGVTVVGPWAQERLSNRVGHVARDNKANGPAAYETLLLLDDSALGILVENAVASDPEIANPARAALAVRVDTWRAKDATGGSFRLALHVERLLIEMEKQTHSLTYSGKAWATRFADRLLAMTSLVPIKKRGPLISAVDHLLDTLATTPTLPDPPEPPVATGSSPLLVIPPVPESPAEEVTESVAAVVESIPPPPESAPAPKSIAANDAVDQEQKTWQPSWRDGKVAEPEPRQLVLDQFEPQPLVVAPAKPLVVPGDYATATDHQLLAALLTHEAALRASQQPRAIGPNTAPSQEDPQLAARLESLGNALRARGFNGVSITHVRLLLSKRVDDRIRLVGQLLVDRTGDTARLLLLLAHDDSADVRVKAITALGSSPRPELVEAAWALALRDKDARVARIAEQIQERRQ